MSKGLAIMLALGLTALPGSVGAQEIGVSVTVVRPAEQPHVESVDGGGSVAVATVVPAGWTWSVDVGADAGGQFARNEGNATARAARSVVHVSPVAVPNGSDDTVTWTFASI